MIAVRLMGRLGNQLFQYAFAHQTAKKFQARFYFDKRFQPEVITPYFDLRLDYLQCLDRHIFSKKNSFFSSYLKFGFYARLPKIFKLKEIEIKEEELPQHEMQKLSDQTYYLGYFQSEQYFSSSKEELIKKFKIRNQYVKQFDALFTTLALPLIYTVVHVRRTDYLDYNIALPASYFHKAVEENPIKNSFYIFISDDPQFVEDEFGYITNKYVSKESEIIDFQFLMHASTCIISNSTFSWWGVYLNKKNALVIAPKYWMGQAAKTENPKGITQKNWLLIEP